MERKEEEILVDKGARADYSGVGVNIVNGVTITIFQ